MASQIERRKFLATLGGAAATWPFVARAQQPAMPVIGWLNGQSAERYSHLLAAFQKGLKEVGYVEGENVTVEYRWANGQYDRTPAFMADLAARQVTVIVAGGGIPSATPFVLATTTIPIVFLTGDDPVKLGLVESLSRPGGNITGVNMFRDPWPWGKPHEAARSHHPSRRCSRVAARGAGAAARACVAHRHHW